MKLGACGLYLGEFLFVIQLTVLMFGVCDMLHLSRPAASTALTLVALSGCRTVAAVINNRGPMSPGVAGLGVVLAVA